MPNEEHILLLGEIKGKLDLVISNQDTSHERFEERFDGLDTRLRKVETKAAINGAVTGGLVAIGFELAKAKLSLLFGGSGQ